MADDKIKSVAIIGAGASGAITAASFVAEKYFEKITVFERRSTPGGTWIYDPTPPAQLPLHPGKFPPDVDPALKIPDELPKVTSPSSQERYTATPIYESLTTNVPNIAMSFSDTTFAYGPFVPHWVTRQYIEGYFSHHKIDTLLSLNTTVEDVSVIRPSSNTGKDRWKLTLRKHDPVLHVDKWWEEEFDAVIFANGHYAVPFIPEVKGLEQYIKGFPGRIIHSKVYRSPLLWKNKRVLVIGNSASGHDVTAELVSTAHLPVFQSRHSASRWDGPEPPPGIAWKPIIKEFLPSGRIIFEDDTYLDDIDTVIYATGYKASFPFWNVKNNGREIYDYKQNKLINNYLHTFLYDFPTLAIIGIPRVLTFRSFEYQAIALARLYSNRQSTPLPPIPVQKKWEQDREEKRRKEGKKFHDVEWESGETLEWLAELYKIAGLNRLTGEGRNPPVLGEEVRWAIEHKKKYPEPGKGKHEPWEEQFENITINGEGEETWVVVKKQNEKDLLAFI